MNNKAARLLGACRLPGALAMSVVALGLNACSGIEGYPHDPEDNDALLATLTPYFDAAHENTYESSTDPTQRQQLRDQIVLKRIRAFDIEFERFEQSLFTEGNSVSVGGDLVALALNGLGATTGDAGTKAALAAASAGVVGAQGAINKDVYYTRTLPAILAQMEANRNNIKAAILKSLQQKDADYPLIKAEMDLDSLKKAGSLPQAISGITQQASDANANAQANVNEELRKTTFCDSATCQKLAAWFQQDKENWPNFMSWVGKDPALQNIPAVMVARGNDPFYEAARKRAIAALIPPDDGGKQ